MVICSIETCNLLIDKKIIAEIMEQKTKPIEALLEKAVEYGKTSLELAKLKALDKTSEVLSSIIPHSVIILLIASFFLFLNLGLAFWIGEFLGKIYFGFFIIAIFYGFVGVFIRLFMFKLLKRKIGNYMVKLLFK